MYQFLILSGGVDGVWGLELDSIGLRLADAAKSRASTTDGIVIWISHKVE